MNKSVSVGEVCIGSGYPVRLQSMTNTDTMDVEATVSQCISIIEAGGELVRITAQGVREAENLRIIKQRLCERGYVNVPLIADIHYSPEAAMIAASIVEKIRINPGNYTDRNRGKFDYTDAEYNNALATIAERVKPLVEVCKAHNTAIRIGSNHGSLSERIISRYGDTPLGMAMAVIEFIDIFESFDFKNIIVSMKASNTIVMVEATRLIFDMMKKRGVVYPLHLGVTEAGEGYEGRIKSAIGIGALLLDGIGDTIRVSLTESPEKEIPAAAKILKYSSALHPQTKCEVVDGVLHFYSELSDKEDFVIEMAVAGSKLAIDRKITDIKVSGKYFNDEECKDMGLMFLQAAKLRITKAEFISCPSCGRTQYDIVKVVGEIKARFSHLKGVTIGVMGCIVNGPGEMAGADYGYVGSGAGKITLFRGKEIVCKNIAEHEAIDRLAQLMRQDGIDV